MLKVNKACIDSASINLKNCDKKLLLSMQQLDTTVANLNDNEALEDEILMLKKISNRIEQSSVQMKQLVRVLDYAAFEYQGCENQAQSLLALSVKENRNRSRFARTVFKIPYAKKINWR
ncbi:MAG: hypothetical protein PUE75_01055 [Eubacteriales bacterium]|nr:hypothetical protein [Eubacteriales bacterium]